jgi:hypothetical protein
MSPIAALAKMLLAQRARTLGARWLAAVCKTPTKRVSKGAQRRAAKRRK